jgi:hypothetical protein
MEDISSLNIRRTDFCDNCLFFQRMIDDFKKKKIPTLEIEQKLAEYGSISHQLSELIGEKQEQLKKLMLKNK